MVSEVDKDNDVSSSFRSASVTLDLQGRINFNEFLAAMHQRGVFGVVFFDSDCLVLSPEGVIARYICATSRVAFPNFAAASRNVAVC